MTGLFAVLGAVFLEHLVELARLPSLHKPEKAARTAKTAR